MEILITILGGYVFATYGNALWDLTKAVWSKLTSKEWEELFLDAFEQTLEEESMRLSKYGDGIVELPREELKKILHQHLAFSFSETSLSELTEDQFVQDLVQALANKESLTIGGHNLNEEDYRSLITGLIRKTNAIFKNTITSDPEKLQQAILRACLKIDHTRNLDSNYEYDHTNNTTIISDRFNKSRMGNP